MVRRADHRLFLLLAALLCCRPLLADCFYDGVSETRLDHLLQQLNQRYGLAALSDQPPDSLIPQPLGDCPADDFLQLISQHSRWQAQTSAAGILLTLDTSPPQPAPQAALPEVVVWGLPDGMSPAAVTRYNSTGLREQADMAPGQLAGDADLTRSVSRLSAVTFSQEAGMDRNISIRGLSPEFSQVLVNGMPMLATSASIDARGAVNNSRDFDFNVLPQGLFTQVVVSKSGDARRGEGAIGGTVDLRSPQPLTADPVAGSRSQWLSLQGENNLTNGAGGQALAAGAQGVNNAADFGWLVGVSYRQRSTQERGFSTVRWQTADWGEQPQLSAEQQAALADGLFYPRHSRYDLLLRQQTTLGLNSVLQWRTAAHGDVDLTLFSARHHQRMNEYHISSAGLKTQDLSDVVVNDFATDASGMVYGSFSAVDIRSEHNLEVDDSRLSQIKLDWRLPLAPAWQLQTSLGWQAAVFDSPQHDKITLMAKDQDFSFDLRDNNRISVNHYGFDLTDPTQWQLNSVTLMEDQVQNRYQVAALELAFDDGGSVRQYAGVQWQGFANERQAAEYDNEDLSGAVGTYYQLTPGNFGRGLGVSGLPRQWLVGSQSYIATLGDVALVRDPTQQRQLDETTLSGWWQTRFEFWQLPWPVRGDAGVRWSSTEQRVRGAWLIDDSAEAVDSLREYHNWLPSLHLVAHARDDLLLRFGYSRDLARPSIDSLTSAVTLSSPSARLVEGGNNQLQPSRAHAFDLSAEWYGDDHQLLSAGLFYKRIDSLILEEVEQVTLDQLPYYNPQWDSQSPADGLYSYRRPVNGPGTDISGLELTLQLPLPAPFEHFGVDAGYAFSRGVVRYPLDDGHITLPPPGLSRHVASGELWYRAGRLALGVNLRARSRYLTRVPGANGNDREGVNAAQIVGAYVRWQADEQLTLSLEARNLTNEAFDLFVDRSNRVYDYSSTGTELMAGLSFRFGD